MTQVEPVTVARRPYQKPEIVEEDVFEREALASCSKVGIDCEAETPSLS